MLHFLKHSFDQGTFIGLVAGACFSTGKAGVLAYLAAVFCFFFPHSLTNMALLGQTALARGKKLLVMAALAHDGKKLVRATQLVRSAGPQVAVKSPVVVLANPCTDSHGV